MRSVELRVELALIFLMPWASLEKICEAFKKRCKTSALSFLSEMCFKIILIF